MFRVKGQKTDSGVPAHPIGNSQCFKGARNRARAALQKMPGATFGIGMEGGLFIQSGRWFEHGAIVVLDRTGKEGVGWSVAVQVPSRIVAIMREEKLDLGTALDRKFQRKDIGRQEGWFGIATNNRITRAQGYREAVISAFAPFLNPALFE
jgi:inosine/xanthosine triphosphatase